jgi:hypothetical protein
MQIRERKEAKLPCCSVPATSVGSQSGRFCQIHPSIPLLLAAVILLSCPVLCAHAGNTPGNMLYTMNAAATGGHVKHRSQQSMNQSCRLFTAPGPADRKIADAQMLLADHTTHNCAVPLARFAVAASDASIMINSIGWHHRTVLPIHMLRLG